MGKSEKTEEKGNNESEKPPVDEETNPKAALEEKIEEKVEKATKAGASKKQAVNIIGEIEEPDPENPEEVRSFLKKVDSKLDQLIALMTPKDPEPGKEEDSGEPEKEEPWYDKPIF